MREFKVGDIVEFGGIRGVVDVTNLSAIYKIHVKFNCNSTIHRESFTLDGRLWIDHKTPLLIFISRLEKKLTLNRKNLVEVLSQYHLGSRAIDILDSFKED